MIILLGSKNESKYRSLEKALNELGITEYEIIPFDVNSGVSSKPIGYEIIRGADNRNQELKAQAINNNIKYDYLCSIEGGFSLDENGLPFVVTYCIIENSLGDKSTGKSLGVRITQTMFDYVKEGGSLNKIIEEITNVENNKKNDGIIGYLSNSFYKRDEIEKEAVISSLIPIIYKENRNKLDESIKLKNQKHL